MNHRSIPAVPLSDAEREFAGRNTGIVYATVKTFAASIAAQLRDRHGWDEDDCVSYLWPAYLRAVQGWRTERGAFATYAVTTLKNALLTALDELPTESRLKGRQEPTVEPEASEHETGEFRGRLSGCVRDAIAKLPQAERLVVALRFFGPKLLTHLEIAEQLGVTRQRVQQLLERAYARMFDAFPNELSDLYDVVCDEERCNA